MVQKHGALTLQVSKYGVLTLLEGISYSSESEGRCDMAAKKEAQKKKSEAKTGIKKGESYVCGVGGLAVSVDEVCGCVDFCDIICCGKPMKMRPAKVRATKK